MPSITTTGFIQSQMRNLFYVCAKLTFRYAHSVNCIYGELVVFLKSVKMKRTDLNVDFLLRA